eukprot:GHVQ01010918.1.p1 GENE.GHVQ01010918.1~~GHVQ01010918.1.p1  ORF type:complete len:316 (-),score=47.52 GHVQ01010918.1:20-967(-)
MPEDSMSATSASHTTKHSLRAPLPTRTTNPHTRTMTTTSCAVSVSSAPHATATTKPKPIVWNLPNSSAVSTSAYRTGKTCNSVFPTLQSVYTTPSSQHTHRAAVQSPWPAPVLLSNRFAMLATSRDSLSETSAVPVPITVDSSSSTALCCPPSTRWADIELDEDELMIEPTSDLSSQRVPGMATNNLCAVPSVPTRKPPLLPTPPRSPAGARQPHPHRADVSHAPPPCFPPPLSAEEPISAYLPASDSSVLLSSVLPLKKRRQPQPAFSEKRKRFRTQASSPTVIGNQSTPSRRQPRSSFRSRYVYVQRTVSDTG